MHTYEERSEIKHKRIENDNESKIKIKCQYLIMST